jgi:hypothetical protein
VQLITLARDLDTVEIPKSVTLTPEEAQLWPEFASARARSDWRRMDLVLLAKIVKLEAMIRKQQAVLDATDLVMGGPKGRIKVNPLITIIDKLQRQQLALIRVLSLTNKEDARVVAGREARMRTLTQALENDEDGLYARPQ